MANNNNNKQPEQNLPSCNHCANILSIPELIEIAVYTVQKINNYPNSFGHTIGNYFPLLYPDEIKAYLMRQAVSTKLKTKYRADYECTESSARSRTKLLTDIKTLCKLSGAQHAIIWWLILEKADEHVAARFAQHAAGEVKSDGT